jgi:hypothetical protein
MYVRTATGRQPNCRNKILLLLLLYQGGNNQLNLRWRGQYQRNEMDYKLEREDDSTYQGGKRL